MQLKVNYVFNECCKVLTWNIFVEVILKVANYFLDSGFIFGVNDFRNNVITTKIKDLLVIFLKDTLKLRVQHFFHLIILYDFRMMYI